MSTIILVFGFNRPDHLKKTLSSLDSQIILLVSQLL